MKSSFKTLFERIEFIGFLHEINKFDKIRSYASRAIIISK